MSPSRQDRSWTACLLWCTPLPVEGATSLLYMLHRDSRYHCGGSKQILCVIRELPRVREAVASRPAFIRGIYSTATAVGAFASQRTKRKGVPLRGHDIPTRFHSFIPGMYIHIYTYNTGTAVGAPSHGRPIQCAAGPAGWSRRQSSMSASRTEEQHCPQAARVRSRSILAALRPGQLRRKWTTSPLSV